MKILAFTDLHASVTGYKHVLAKSKKGKPDIIICCGDFTIFEQNIEAVLDKINDLPAPVYLLHGNHEQDVIVQKLCKRYKNITFIHRAIVKSGDLTIVGHGGGGFYGQGKNAGDKDFDKFIKESSKKLTGKMILVTHAPPQNTQLDYLEWMDEHVGCSSYTDFIKKYNPALALSGHIHETFGTTQKFGKTVLCNPGPEGMLIQL
ncbi:hypothetical protein C4580_05565 [Candidatus Woesearchaeota archaeon]|nr:MAG: hypothetical protein C4580_05565 [Candidatus Woesearchaeota archaeon]